MKPLQTFVEANKENVSKPLLDEMYDFIDSRPKKNIFKDKKINNDILS